MKILYGPLQFILKILARITLWRYRPIIIAITGSMGKTSTKEAIFSVLKEDFSVRRNIKNYNNEIGLPLTILGVTSAGRSIIGWFFNFIKAFLFLIYYPKYPKILVLEMGVDKPGDMEYLMSIVRPHISVFTGVGDIPVHVEFFKGPKALAREKGKIIKYLTRNDFAVLNIDDPLVANRADKTKAKIISYGFSDEADFCPQELDFSYSLDEQDILGISFKIISSGKVVPFRLSGILGYHQLYVALAAIAVGKILGMNLVEISNHLADYQGPAGRMRLLGGVKNSFIIDDTYNASPTATQKALETLGDIPAEGKKIAVLGDMLELGSYAQKAHRKIGRLALEVSDIFIAVGPFMKTAFLEAKKRGFATSNLYFFNSADEAKKKVEELIDPGDLILVKGSQSMRMEKVVLEIMQEPQKAKELLVRQDRQWQK